MEITLDSSTPVWPTSPKGKPSFYEEDFFYRANPNLAQFTHAQAAEASLDFQHPGGSAPCPFEVTSGTLTHALATSPATRRVCLQLG